MNREEVLKAIKDSSNRWDFIVIGGGASGLGTALDAASRGYKTLLLEQGDFSQGTSSKSTKLIHGGLRYLGQGFISLVFEALREQRILLLNAPHLVHPLSFLLPTSSWFNRYYYFAGIKLYELLAGRRGVEKSYLLSKKEVLQNLITVNPDVLNGGVFFVDGQFDDSRLAINLAETIIEKGGFAINYFQVTGLLKDKDKLIGVRAQDLENNQTYEILAKVIINASGAYADSIRKMDDHNASACIVLSQGSHIVLDRSFFPSDFAMLIPKTSDGRLLFMIPWHNRVLIGTTDVPLEHLNSEPTPKKTEIEYLLRYARQYLIKKPDEKDILSAFAGIRPLIRPKEGWKSTSSISRDFSIIISNSKLITVLGGKWTTYRKMGEDTINKAIQAAGLPYKPSITKHLPIHGSYTNFFNDSNEWSYYGSDYPLVDQLGASDSSLKEKLHPELPCRKVDVIWAVRQEMARQVEDVLSRRTRCLLLGAKISVEIASKVAAIMAKELGKDNLWEKKQVESYTHLAKGYIV